MWLVGLACWAAVTNLAWGDDEFADVKTIRSLPRTQSELDRLHSENSGNRCDQIAEGQSLETNSFAIIRTARHNSSRPAARHCVISVGLTMDSSDQAALPMISRKTILEYLDDNYVSIQVRVRRDLIDGKLYYHHLPLAATAQFRGSKVTQRFQPVISNAMNEFRSVGLFTRSSPQERKPEDLRTLVMIFKNSILKSGERTGSQFEYAFVRGRPTDAGSERLKSHVFVTAKNRTQLVYLNPYGHPARPDNCSIRGSIAITEFDKSGITPREGATRSYRLDARRFFPMENIEAYCKDKQLQGGFHDHVDTVLDVLIDQMEAKK